MYCCVWMWAPLGHGGHVWGLHLVMTMATSFNSTVRDRLCIFLLYYTHCSRLRLRRQSSSLSTLSFVDRHYASDHTNTWHCSLSPVGGHLRGNVGPMQKSSRNCSASTPAWYRRHGFSIRTNACCGRRVRRLRFFRVPNLLISTHLYCKI